MDSESISSLGQSSGTETLNVSKIVDKGNGNKEISILTDVVADKKEDDEDDKAKIESTRKERMAKLWGQG